MPVDDSPLTRASLLVQIRDGTNHVAWQEFSSCTARSFTASLASAGCRMPTRPT